MVGMSFRTCALRLFLSLSLLPWGLAPGPAPAADKMLNDGNVLFIGDSHMTVGFGPTLDAILRNKISSNVTSIGSCGTVPEDWNEDDVKAAREQEVVHHRYPRAGRTTCGYWEQTKASPISAPVFKHETPSLKKLMQDKEPALTVIAWGTNMLGSSQTALCKRLKKTMAQIPQNKPCFWIGPPHSTRLPPGTVGNADTVVKLTADRLKRVVESPAETCGWTAETDPHPVCKFEDSQDRPARAGRPAQACSGHPPYQAPEPGTNYCLRNGRRIGCPDGRHFYGNQANRWASCIGTKILADLPDLLARTLQGSGASTLVRQSHSEEE